MGELGIFEMALACLPIDNGIQKCKTKVHGCNEMGRIRDDWEMDWLAKVNLLQGNAWISHLPSHEV